MTKRFLLAFCFAALSLVVSAARAEQELLVSAAASLSNVFKEIGRGFAAANPGVRVTFNFASSGSLLKQIERGAPVDVFASADQETMDLARDAKLIVDASRRDFTANKLVLIVPASSALAVTGPGDLDRPPVKRIALGNPALVPAGRYAHGALGDVRLNVLKPKLVFAESVRQMLQYVVRGEVDAAFVYASDAASEADRVRVVAILSTSKPITYPAAVVAASKQQVLARRFVDYLLDSAVQALLKRYGFGA